MAALLAEEVGLEGARVEDVRLAGLLHDVGKIGVSDELIVRAGPLSAEEWVEMRQHPEIDFYRLLRFYSIILVVVVVVVVVMHGVPMKMIV